MKVLCSEQYLYYAVWYRYPNGVEGERMQVQSRPFSEYEQAVAFLNLKSQRTLGKYWAGGCVEDSDGIVGYEITSDYEVLDNLGAFEEKLQ